MKDKLKVKKGLKTADKKPSDEKISTVDDLCKMLKFRSRNPKVIDLTANEDERMPETLNELAVRCKKEEKDLFMYYYLSRKTAESSVIFCNSITCTKRVSSILTSMKIPNQCLHSKMQ